MNGLLAAEPRYVRCRRVITRPEDAGGEDFEGVSEAEFKARVDRGYFALWWRAHGLAYGIPAASTNDALEAGMDVLANLSRAIVHEAWSVFPTLTVLSITAPVEVLEKRLERRGREDEDDIAARLARPIRALPQGVPLISIDNSGDLDGSVREARMALARRLSHAASV